MPDESYDWLELPKVLNDIDFYNIFFYYKINDIRACNIFLHANDFYRFNDIQNQRESRVFLYEFHRNMKNRLTKIY